ncbi:MAG TPA: hypothetical protein PKE55_08745, partial [Kiritimatiellia bacterium]|nr:hypothetical protein [Kiritimatiellia bacterium]
YIEAMAQTQLPLPFTGEAAPTLLHFLASLVYKIIPLTLHPLLMTSPLAPLATGYLIPWTTTATTLLTKVLLYSGALALLSTAVLNRREIALPST